MNLSPKVPFVKLTRSVGLWTWRTVIVSPFAPPKEAGALEALLTNLNLLQVVSFCLFRKN